MYKIGWALGRKDGCGNVEFQTDIGSHGMPVLFATRENARRIKKIWEHLYGHKFVVVKMILISG